MKIGGKKQNAFNHEDRKYYWLYRLAPIPKEGKRGKRLNESVRTTRL